MTFGIIGNITKPVISKVIPDLLSWLDKREISYIIEDQLLDYLNLTQKSVPVCKAGCIGANCDMVLAFGGDGTILSTARSVGSHSTPILGVNLGGLGFLAEITISQLYACIEDILHEDYTILERMVLKAEIINQEDGVTFYGLNDIVVDKSNTTRVMRVNISINEEFLTTYLCDGVIIATPTGSTAYSLSAMGPILAPDVDAIIINPICPHSLGARPMVISGDSRIQIYPHVGNQEATLSADGQVADNIKPNEYIIVEKAGYKTRTVQYKGNTFYNLLRTKLSWGVDKRMD
ncbi:NAD(+) kinase [candidate division KSB1 bacterium]|nr:NAD(+) kinase [candidate division KSB1 bacterium]